MSGGGCQIRVKGNWEFGGNCLCEEERLNALISLKIADGYIHLRYYFIIKNLN